MVSELHKWPFLEQLTVGSPVRFKSPYTNNIVISEVKMWAGFKVVQEHTVEHKRMLSSGTPVLIKEYSRYIRLTQLSQIEEITATEYFLHRLRNG